MTEQEWLQDANTYSMFGLIGPTASPRKLRLFAVECCQKIRPLTRDVHTSKALDVATQVAEGFAFPESLKAESATAMNAARTALREHYRLVEIAAYHAALAIGWATFEDPLCAWDASTECAKALRAAALDRSHGDDDFTERVRAEQAELLRDIFGNPFRPVTLDPRWLTSTVLDLARIIYDERVYERMPILADALMDAGCDSEEILSHCRGPGPHVRGCWVVDLLLARE
jgi:hypothetical protein